MAKIKGLTITFSPSPSPDVVTHRLYVAEVPGPVTYDSQSFDIGNVPIDGVITVNLQTLMPDVDGVYNIGIAAVDDAGNESNMSTKDDLPLDFAAPAAPGEIAILLI